MKNLKYKILLALFLLSLASSLVLSIFPVPVVCDPGVGCDVVKTSSYNFTLGIRNSYYGSAIFLAISLLAYFQIKNPTEKKRKLINLGVIIGFVIAIYFLYIQKFILNAYCKYCLIVDFSMIIALMVTLIWWKE